MTASKAASNEIRHHDGSPAQRKSPKASLGLTEFSIAVELCLLILLMGWFAPRMHAQQVQQTRIVNCPQPGLNLNIIPEIGDDGAGHLKATLILTDNGNRVMWEPGTSRCATQPMRFFRGHKGNHLAEGPAKDDFDGTIPLPGPTFRAKVGDLVEITFVNRINTQQFANSLDRGAVGTTGSCDITNGQAAGGVFPNCLHGSSTANVHFHGTHTTPNTTGDNVLLFIRPSMGSPGRWRPTDSEINTNFAEFFTKCEEKSYPDHWKQMPETWQTLQKDLFKDYDEHTPYQGKPGPLPATAQISPVNDKEIAHGLWPQYHMGAVPYCFPLPEYKEDAKGNPTNGLMGQAPGTHWYHAHKHGSTALNVANGMTGAFIIEGKYDADLLKFYKKQPGWDFQQKVLVIQQLTTTLNLTNPVGTGPHTRPVPVLSVNGGRGSVTGDPGPVVEMRPNQVQLFRFVNGAERDAAKFLYFVPHLLGAKPCTSTPNQCVTWHQIAQDGVQFNYDNYENTADNQGFNLAPGNRADLLVKAPASGTYDLKVQAGLCRNDCNPQIETLLTVKVTGTDINPPMTFLDEAGYPEFPKFLKDIPADSVFTRREIVFQDVPGVGLLINGKLFEDGVINQAMLLNSVEEWKISNLDDDREHPFHIHINPFQIIEVFQPQSADAKPGGKCYADPLKPETWKQCDPPQKDFVWWDVFAIPAARQDTLPSTVCTTIDGCPANIRKYTSCNKGACTVTIPGYFRMRSRFADFPGQYVLHCHILTHEDRGMMELIEVVPNTTEYSHH